MFTATYVGDTSFENLNVCNTGAANLLVDSIISSNTQFAVTEPSSGYPVAISPDFCFPFQVTYTPTGAGAHSATLTIESNEISAARAQVEVELFGDGIEQDIDTLIADTGDFGDVCISAFKDLGLTVSNSDVAVSGNVPPGDVRVTGSTDFGDVCAETLAEKNIEVCNVGACNLSVSSVAIDCADFTLIVNKPRLDSVDNARNLPLETVTPNAPCGPFQYHREYGTVSNPIQLAPGSYRLSATVRIDRHQRKLTVGFDISTCGFNPTIVVDFAD